MEYQSFVKSCDVNISKVSKILQQYLNIKRQNADSVVFFRLGDFYETYFEDAVILSKVSGVLLTKRKFSEVGEIPMAGVPWANADVYISKLVNEKYKVSIVEQVQKKEDVKKGEIIKREVVRTYSPGTLIDENFLDSRKNNFIASVLKDNNKYGFSYADISTGEFYVTEGNFDEILCELSKVNPSELLIKIKPRKIEPLKSVPDEEPDIEKEIWENYPYTLISGELYNEEFTNDGLLEYRIGLKCVNSIINYAKKTQKNFMPKLDVVKKYSISGHLIMNAKTRESLEINKNLKDGKKYGSLFWAVDFCKTSMGKRLLASFLNEPLYNINKINKRLDAVEEMILNQEKLEKLSKLLENLGDISRLSSKLSNGTIAPKELLSIKTTLAIIEDFIEISSSFKSEILKNTSECEVLLSFRDIIERTIKEEPAVGLRVGGIIKDGANGVLDSIRAEISMVMDKITCYEEELAGITNIKNLKITYAKNTGYSIDIPISSVKMFVNNVEDFTRKQKLSSVEKFTTKKLAELEEKILSLRLKSYELEFDIYSKLKEYAKELVQPLRDFSYEVSVKDVMASFATLALKEGFVRPKFCSEYKYMLKEGINPVLMQLCTSLNAPYDKMDADFNEDVKIKILTGANMSGKSTYLREIAALTVLAQSGSFLPCKAFEANIVDKIFVRMGSSDDMLNSNSAFMCEMLDIAEILRNATPKSLILLDETGKSTSYRDGISISYGIIKFIEKEVGAKTVLATHFHDLSMLENEGQFIKNYRLVMDEKNGKLQRRLELGFLTDSFGLHAAMKANLPLQVIERAENFSQKIAFKHNK